MFCGLKYQEISPLSTMATTNITNRSPLSTMDWNRHWSYDGAIAPQTTFSPLLLVTLAIMKQIATIHVAGKNVDNNANGDHYNWRQWRQSWQWHQCWQWQDWVWITISKNPSLLKSAIVECRHWNGGKWQWSNGIRIHNHCRSPVATMMIAYWRQ